MSLAPDQWAANRAIRPDVITASRLLGNGLIESLKDKLRGERLNKHHFPAQVDARIALQEWREECHTNRLRRSLV